MSYIGGTLNDKYGKAAIPLHAIDINVLEDGLLDVFRGGTLIVYYEESEKFV